jgi:hypothetical protein
LLSIQSRLDVYSSSCTMIPYRRLRRILESWQLASMDLDIQEALSTASFPMCVSLCHSDPLSNELLYIYIFSSCYRVVISRVTTVRVASQYTGRNSQACFTSSSGSKEVNEAHRREFWTSPHQAWPSVHGKCWPKH